MIRYSNTRIKIYLDNFLAREREELIARLRELIAEDCQTNWDVFSRSQLAQSTHLPESRSIAILCMAMYFTIAIVLIYCWHIRLGVQFLVFGLACALAALWYLIRIIKFVPDSEATA